MEQRDFADETRSPQQKEGQNMPNSTESAGSRRRLFRNSSVNSVDQLPPVQPVIKSYLEMQEYWRKYAQDCLKISTSAQTAVSACDKKRKEPKSPCSDSFFMLGRPSKRALTQFDLGKPSSQSDSKGLTLYPCSSTGPPKSQLPDQGKVQWKDRFVKLQMFLRRLDQSNQQEYIQRLRSLSEVNRRRTAMELERRAVHLLAEEGKELEKMKRLNVMDSVPLD
ncbi:uncharacterized protein LOC144710339 [Wolffia australiana]